MSNAKLTPDYLFEVSWEVCNKIGGIHTVVSTKAQTAIRKFNERYILIGPDLQHEGVNPEFEEDPNLLKTGVRGFTPKASASAWDTGKSRANRRRYWWTSPR